MNSVFIRRRGPRKARTPARHCRPQVERLECRELLAFDLTISLAKSLNVSKDTARGTTTFTASASGANVSVDDIDSALADGNDVVVTSGAAGTQAGNISTSGFTSHTFSNVPSTTLTIESGTGTNLVGNITLAGLRLKGIKSSLVVSAKNNVSTGQIDSDLGGPLGSVIFVAGGTITLGDAVTASTVRLKSAGNLTQTASGIISATALGAHSTSGNVDLDVGVNAVKDTFAARTDALNGFVEFHNATGFATGRVTASGGFDATVTGITTNGGRVTMAADTGTLTLGTAGVANSGIDTGVGNLVRLQATTGGVSQTADGAIASNFLGVRAAAAVALAAAA